MCSAFSLILCQPFTLFRLCCSFFPLVSPLLVVDFSSIYFPTYWSFPVSYKTMMRSTQSFFFYEPSFPSTPLLFFQAVNWKRPLITKPHFIPFLTPKFLDPNSLLSPQPPFLPASGTRTFLIPPFRWASARFSQLVF